jgi:hypothetical protein
MQRNAFSSEDALSDASMEDRVLNFLESQRLRFNILYKRERGTIIVTKRERTRLFSTAALRERLLRVSRIPIFNFGIALGAATRENHNAKTVSIPSISRDSIFQ